MIQRGYRWPVLPIVLALLGPAAGGLAAQDSTAAAADSSAAVSDSTAAVPGPTVAAPDSSARTPDSTAVARPRTGALPDTAVVVDRVVAVVGNRPVLASQVDEEMFSRQSQGQHLPSDPDSHRGHPEAGRRTRSWTRNCWCSRRSATPASR